MQAVGAVGAVQGGGVEARSDMQFLLVEFPGVDQSVPVVQGLDQIAIV